MERINVAELLRNCPKGMELDCTMYENVTFVRVDMSRKQFPIEIAVSGIRSKYLTKEGCFHDTTLSPESKCVIFPKGKTTWKGFQRPFKDGDVVYVYDEYSDATFTYIAILKQIGKGGQIYSHCFYNCEDDIFSTHDYLCDDCNIRFATEEEKAKLFKAIRDNGYKWNEETKTLERVLKFKVGDRIKQIGSDRYYIIKNIEFDRYILNNNQFIRFTDENIYKLVPNKKFDINTLKPFDKVLVRCGLLDRWRMQFFKKYDETDKYPFICMWHNKYNQCVPYGGNEHLLDTNDDCDEYFKTWK